VVRCRLIWAIEENNRAVKASRSDVVPFEIYDFLKNRYKWRRGEGGVFYYQSEYTRMDASEYGCSPIEESHYYGPLGERAQADRLKRLK